MPNTSAPAQRPPTRVHISWDGDHCFDAGRPGGVPSRIDASGTTGPGPVDTLLSALATCASVDVVDILGKRHTPAERLTVDVTGDRANATPARVTRVSLAFAIDGQGIARGPAERAIDLAVSKYCSVRGSLDPKLPIVFSLTLNGEPGETIATGAVAAPTD